MAKKQNTEIKFTEIKSLAEQNNQTEVFEFENGSTLTFYPVFPDNLIEKMFEEISNIFAKEEQKKKGKIELNENMIHKYVIYMLIKHFTHLKSQLKASTLIGQLNELNSIVDSGYYQIIANEVFDQKEIYKVFDRMAEISGRFMFLKRLDEKMHNEVSKLELKNRDVFANLNINKEKQIPEV